MEVYKVAMKLLSRISEIVDESDVVQEFENELWVRMPRKDWEWLRELGHTVKGD